MRGDLQASEQHYRELLSFYDPEKHLDPVHLAGLELGSAARGMIAVAKASMGYPTQAAEWMREALSTARQRKNNPSEAYILLWDVLFRVQLLEVETALERIDSLRDSLSELGMELLFGPYSDICEGWCRSQRGEAEAGARLARAGLDELLRTGQQTAITHMAALVAQAWSCAGHPEEALRFFDDLRAKADTVGERWLVGETLQIRGDLLLALPTPDREGAEETFREAIQEAKADKAKSVSYTHLTLPTN